MAWNTLWDRGNEMKFLWPCVQFHGKRPPGCCIATWFTFFGFSNMEKHNLLIIREFECDNSILSDLQNLDICFPKVFYLSKVI